MFSVAAVPGTRINCASPAFATATANHEANPLEGVLWVGNLQRASTTSRAQFKIFWTTVMLLALEIICATENGNRAAKVTLVKRLTALREVNRLA